MENNKLTKFWGINTGCHESPAHQTILTQSQLFRSRTLKNLRHSSSHSQLSQTLKAHTNSKLIKDLSREVEALKHTPGLVENIFKLKQMNLLKEKNLFVTTYSQIPHSPVYNDYHTRQTNPGYSRNKLGGFFTK